MRPPLFATTASAWRPMGGEASPFAASFVHVAPPSADLKTAGSRLNGGPPGPGVGASGTIGRARDTPRTPEEGYSVANRTRGASGAATTEGQPAVSSTNSTFVHVRPPSVVRKIPRSWLGVRSPIAPTTTSSGLVALMTIDPIKWVSRRPTLVHDFPPSIDLYTPSPRVSSPVPA